MCGWSLIDKITFQGIPNYHSEPQLMSSYSPNRVKVKSDPKCSKSYKKQSIVGCSSIYPGTKFWFYCSILFALCNYCILGIYSSTLFTLCNYYIPTGRTGHGSGLQPEPHQAYLGISKTQQH